MFEKKNIPHYKFDLAYCLNKLQIFRIQRTWLFEGTLNCLAFYVYKNIWALF